MNPAVNTSDALPAPPGPRTITLEHALALVARAAYPARVHCTTCGGAGYVPDPARLLVHTRRDGLGADNDLTEVIAELATAEALTYRESSLVGPIVFAKLPRDRGLSIDVTEPAVS